VGHAPERRRRPGTRPTRQMRAGGRSAWPTAACVRAVSRRLRSRPAGSDAPAGGLDPGPDPGEKPGRHGLEATQSTLTSVVSALFGRRGRRRLAARVAGERAPNTLAARARGVWRRHQSQRALARTGPVSRPSCRLSQGAVERSARRDRQRTDLEPPLGARMAPVAPSRAQLTRLPGRRGDRRAGDPGALSPERRHCGSAARRASGAGVCPGPDETRRHAGVRPHPPRAPLSPPGARAVCRGRPQPPTVLGHTCRRLDGRRGGTHAAMAVAHHMLVMVYHRLREGTDAEEARDDRRQDRPEERQQKRAVKALERLGSRVTLERLASRSGTSPLLLHAPLASPSWRHTRVRGESSVSGCERFRGKCPEPTSFTPAGNEADLPRIHQHVITRHRR